jgi:hypothetical protein
MINVRKANLGDYLAGLHTGQWFGIKDVSKGHVHDNIIVHDKSKKLPSKSECEKGIKTLQAEWDARAIDQQRQSAYQAESDPLFFKYQRGEATEQDWLDKVAEIKARFPK